MTQATAHSITKADAYDPATDYCFLTYDERFLRRKTLRTVGGLSFLADLPQTTSLDEGDAFQLSNGEIIPIRAAPEPLLEVRGDITRLAWHIGNRHMPCQIEETRLLIQRDHVIAGMLAKLGATTADVLEPFTPEGGAYGHGRTHSHSHGDHSHGH